MARLSSPRLSVYAALLVLSIGVIQLVASLLFYRSIDENTLREDHARRVAELLVVSARVDRIDGDVTSSVMSSRHLQVSLGARPSVAQPSDDGVLQIVARRIVTWEPSLAGRPLNLATQEVQGKRLDLVGSMQLADGRWLNFRSRDISSMWPIALRAMWLTLVTSLVCLGIGLMAIRLLTKPLRRLADAADAIGEGRRVDIREDGPADLRNLAHAMNEMQERIGGLVADQAKSFEAISHDLRTPLARQKLATDMIDDPEIREIVGSSTDEMEGMLQSLQQFLRAQHVTAEAEEMDLVVALRGLVAPFGGEVRSPSGGDGVVRTYRQPLLLALQALIENAYRFGDTVDVAIDRRGGDWFVEIKDNGPGIPEHHFEDVLAPFFRLDEARGRTTQGFGLGIPTAHRLLRRFGGDLAFSSQPSGGLVVRVRVPRAS